MLPAHFSFSPTSFLFTDISRLFCFLHIPPLSHPHSSSFSFPQRLFGTWHWAQRYQTINKTQPGRLSPSAQLDLSSQTTIVVLLFFLLYKMQSPHATSRLSIPHPSSQNPLPLLLEWRRHTLTLSSYCLQWLLSLPSICNNPDCPLRSCPSPPSQLSSTCHP